MIFIFSRAKSLATLVAVLAAATALMAPAASPAAERAAASRVAQECWSTPGNPWPWNVTCIRGPHRYRAQCNMMRSVKANAGHEVRACHWRAWNGRPGYYFFYSFYQVF